MFCYSLSLLFTTFNYQDLKRPVIGIIQLVKMELVSNMLVQHYQHYHWSSRKQNHRRRRLRRRLI